MSYNYSVLYCTQASRQKILTLRALNNAFKNIAFKSQPEIIQAQFDFWKNELNESKPSHPLLKALPFHEIAKDLSALLRYYQSDSNTSLYEKKSDLEAYYQNTGGYVETLLYKMLLASSENHAFETPEKLGIFIAKAEDFFNLRKNILNGKIYIPGECLLEYQTTLYELSTLEIKANIDALLKNEINRLLKFFPERIDKDFYPSFTLAKIYQARLVEINQNIAQFFTYQIDITPLRKFWIAWRIKPKILL